MDGSFRPSQSADVPGVKAKRGLFVLLGAMAVGVAIGWFLTRPASDLETTRRQFAELQHQIESARRDQAVRTADRRQLLRLQAQSRSASDASSRASFDAAAAAIQARLGWGDAASVRAIVHARPLVGLAKPAAPQGVMPVFVTEGNGCAACHLAIATPGFETYPAPFRTHPNLPLYVGAASPHSPSRFTCTSCHRGNGSATSFEDAGHARLASAGAQEGPGPRWKDAAAETAMLPVGRLEAGCVACHEGERAEPGAPRLNEALATLERSGCYGCHEVPGLSKARRRGPDLRRIGGKLTPAWVRQWLADPRAVKPATWMPRFWPAPSAEDERAEIDAVVAYLFANGEEYRPATVSPPRGDPSRGKALVQSVGCLGCHVEDEAVRDRLSPRRTFGQPLEAIGSKTSHAWLYDWLRQPSRYSPDTAMPDLRLSEVEAADIAAYLESSAGRTPAQISPAPAPAPDSVYRDIIRRRAASRAPLDAEAAAASGDRLRVLAGRAVIGAIGCFNCHDIRGFDRPASRPAIAARRAWRDQDVAAIHATAVATAPFADFGFGPDERARVATALSAIAGPVANRHAIAMPWHLREASGRALVQERNCVGCHPIEGGGGDYLTLVSDPSLGPPLLTPEGARVQGSWLRRFLRQPRTIRPWLSVRMPTFGWNDDDLDRVSEYFGEIARPNPEPTDAPAPPAASGTELFDLLKCQQCHVLGTVPTDQPTSNLAPDLRMAHERLQPDWILAWLRNPSAILPGTRMPAFWPDYPKSFYPPLDRNAEAQIRALRDHVLDLR
jgi:mono/diheme cytochrome c family protein